MASLKDVERLTDDLENLVDQLRSELKGSPDFEKLIQISDEISEQADNAASTFSTVNEALMSRIQELGSGGKSRASGNSSSRTREKAQSTA
jgi:ABC-type transporter Mla subunit MlaD